MPPMLEVDGVSVRYGQVVAVRTAAMVVDESEFLALVGPNGHGKSSLVAAIAGIRPHRGTIRAFGEVLRPGTSTDAVRRGIVLVPERRHLFASMSVRDNVLLGSFSTQHRPRGVTKAWRAVADVLEIFPALGSRLEQPAGTLSGGQQQMVALARALVARPKVLLLDEPCLGLAEAIAVELYSVLRELNEGGMTVLVTEEDPTRAVRAATRVVHMYRGEISACTDGEPERTGVGAR